MNNNFVIGNSPIGTEAPCFLKFHEFVLYDSVNWTQTGVLKWDAINKCFFVLPDIVVQEQQIEPLEQVQEEEPILPL